jgi:GT2 family glycosyltransferase
MQPEKSSPIVLVVSFRRPELLERCLAAVLVHEPAAKIYVWDNRSDHTDEIKRLSSRYPTVHWHFSAQNVGFASAVNELVSMAAPERTFVLLNPDAELQGPLDQLVRAVEQGERIAMAGPWIESDHLNLWDNARPAPNPASAAIDAAGLGRIVRVPGLRSRYRHPPEHPGYLSGACCAISMAAWKAVGALDERFWLYSEEADWALRARRSGWRLRQLPCCLVRHDAGGTTTDSVELSERSSELLARSREIYLGKHFGRLGLAGFRVALGALNAVQGVRERRSLGHGPSR